MSRGALAWALLALAAGCGSDAGGFVGFRALNLCSDNVPVCNTSAGCVLTEGQYLEGTLPGARSFVFRTEGPAKVRVRMLFFEQRSPGRDTQIEWNEIGCGTQRFFSTMGRDLFQLIGDTQQLSVEQPLDTPGDHLLRLRSDATSRYQLRVEVADPSGGS